MLLWEALAIPFGQEKTEVVVNGVPGLRSMRLPFDKGCMAIAKSGHRCKGKARPGTEWCLFHDPEFVVKRNAVGVRKPAQRNPLSRLPDGYLRKLSSRRAIGNAMDRLYREVRLGTVTPGMGQVLFGILTRLLDSGLCEKGFPGTMSSGRSKADRVRPKLKEILTRSERIAWKKAVKEAPESLILTRKLTLAPKPVDSPVDARSDLALGDSAGIRAIQIA
ncbi:MAG: hypothetical protein AABZ47_01360 [Planctomycetota bacterium]